MLGEALDTSVNAIEGLLLWYGERRSRRPPDDTSLRLWPRGLFLEFRGGAADLRRRRHGGVYEGLDQILHPREIESARLLYPVLVVTAAFNGYSCWVARRRFAEERRGLSLAEAVVRSKDAPTLLVMLENGAGVIGAAVALAGVALSREACVLEADGVASCLIGLLLSATAWIIARETKGLLIGEPARRHVRERVLELARRQSAVAGGLGNQQLAAVARPDRGHAATELLRRPAHPADRAGRRKAGGAGVRGHPRGHRPVRPPRGRAPLDCRTARRSSALDMPERPGMLRLRASAYNSALLGAPPWSRACAVSPRASFALVLLRFSLFFFGDSNFEAPLVQADGDGLPGGLHLLAGRGFEFAVLVFMHHPRDGFLLLFRLFWPWKTPLSRCAKHASAAPDRGAQSRGGRLSEK